MLREAWEMMPVEAQIAHAKHASELDRACARLASTNAYACEAGLEFDKHLKECGPGKHSFQAVVERIYWIIFDEMQSNPSAEWREIAERCTSDKDVINQLAWSFI